MESYSTKTATNTVADSIDRAASEPTLVLLSGGSSAVVGAGALSKLDPAKYHNITVMLADERFVQYNSADSNAYLLKSLKITDYCSKFIETLDKNNSDANDVTETFRQNLTRLVAQANSVIAVFGIGADNHIAGILPNTVAATSSDEFALYYETPKFKRITISPNVFSKIDTAFLYAEGAEKEAAIMALDVDHDSVTYPSQLIKQSKQWQVMYNKENL